MSTRTFEPSDRTDSFHLLATFAFGLGAYYSPEGLRELNARSMDRIGVDYETVMRVDWPDIQVQLFTALQNDRDAEGQSLMLAARARLAQAVARRLFPTIGSYLASK